MQNLSSDQKIKQQLQDLNDQAYTVMGEGKDRKREQDFLSLLSKFPTVFRRNFIFRALYNHHDKGNFFASRAYLIEGMRGDHDAQEKYYQTRCISCKFITRALIQELNKLNNNFCKKISELDEKGKLFEDMPAKERNDYAIGLSKALNSILAPFRSLSEYRAIAELLGQGIRVNLDLLAKLCPAEIDTIRTIKSPHLFQIFAEPIQKTVDLNTRATVLMDSIEILRFPFSDEVIQKIINSKNTAWDLPNNRYFKRIAHIGAMVEDLPKELQTQFISLGLSDIERKGFYNHIDRIANRLTLQDEEVVTDEGQVHFEKRETRETEINESMPSVELAVRGSRFKSLLANGFSRDEANSIARKSIKLGLQLTDFQKLLEQATDITAAESFLTRSRVPKKSFAGAQIVSIKVGSNDKTKTIQEQVELVTCKELPFMAWYSDLDKQLKYKIAGKLLKVELGNDCFIKLVRKDLFEIKIIPNWRIYFTRLVDNKIVVLKGGA